MRGGALFAGTGGDIDRMIWLAVSGAGEVARVAQLCKVSGDQPRM